MPFSLMNVIDIALMLYLVVWLFAARTRNGAPWRWRAYRCLRWIPTWLCLLSMSVATLICMATLIGSKHWKYPGTPAYFLLEIALQVLLVAPVVPTSRWIVVPGQIPARQRRDRMTATYAVTFERESSSELGLHIRRTDGCLTVFRQHLPDRVSNVGIALSAIATYRDQLRSAGVRTVRVASPDVTPKVMEHMARHAQKYLLGIRWEPLEPRRLRRTKRAMLLWVREREPLPTSDGCWKHVLRTLATVATMDAWRRTGRRIRRAWAASSEPMFERGIRIDL